MTPAPSRITLVTSAHVANNPRLVKEADALTEAGHRVRVVAPLHHEYLAARDDALMAGRRWRLQRVEVGRTSRRGRWRRLIGASTERLARLLFARGIRTAAVADRALSRHLDLMVRAAAAEPADLVVGHNVQALPVAARAAHLLGARLAFDIEDLHSGELPDTPEHATWRDLVRHVEQRYLPRCALLTASSAGIADEVARLYGVRRPEVILNVFPREELARPLAAEDERPAGARVSLYWYSQVVGPGRGLEEALQALAKLPGDVHLSLRGEPDRDFARSLRADAHRLGVVERLHFLRPVAPTELVPRAALHDIGLALEQPVTRNRQLCVTNKIFTYLLAGLAVAATETDGQRPIMEAAAGAGFLYPPGDAEALARGLAALASAPAGLAAARRASAEAAATRFHWEREREVLVRHLTGDGAAGARADEMACGAS